MPTNNTKDRRTGICPVLFVAAVLVGVSVTTALNGFSVAAQPPGGSFEVASIKQNKSNSLVERIGVLPGGRFDAINVPLTSLIRWAYRLDRLELEGGPDWIARDRFDVIAKADGSTPSVDTMMRAMVQSLMGDRFKLVVHRESREQPVYALVVSRSDRRLGPQLTPASVDCSPDAIAARASSSQSAVGQSAPRCGLLMRPGEALSGQVRIPDLAAALVGLVQRKVLDRTGLDGTYAVTLSFNPDPGTPGAAFADQNAASIFTALQEQLGLKLEAQRAPIEILVIDSAQRPTED